MSYKEEIKSLISNEELIQNIDWGFKDIFIDNLGYKHILYKTTCIPTGKIYIGIHSILDGIKDRYIGCGIDSKNVDHGLFGISHFKRAVEKYGYKNFKREDLLYFKNREDLIKAEVLIVDKNFINDIRTLNSCVGGGNPPRKVGKDNGNYGNKWSEEKRRKASEYFKENRNGSYGNNGNAKSVIIIDYITDKIFTFTSIREAGEFIGIKPSSIGAFLTNNDEFFHISYRRYICIFKENYDSIVDKDMFYQNIEEKVIRKYKVYKEIYNNINDNVILQKYNINTTQLKYYKYEYNKKY